MGHRLFSFVFVAASISALFVGDIAHAGPKSSGARTKPRTGAKPAANAAPAPPPAPPAIKKIPVCVRPKDVDDKTNEWTFSETRKPVVTDIENTAKRIGQRIYIFDAKAPLDSPRSFPAPHNQLKCESDTREPVAAPAPEPKAPGILGPAGPWFASANPLAPSALASSGTGKSNAELVNQFVQAAANFQPSGNNDEVQASQVARRLRDSITQSRSFPEFTSRDLSAAGAGVLTNVFGESIVAALADRSAVGPLQVMQKLAASGKKANWSVLPLVSNEAMADREIIEPNEVPAVILSTADFQHRKSLVASMVPWALPADSLKGAYQKAYADKPEWIKAIAAYF
jgi:hypothetical protein